MTLFSYGFGPEAIDPPGIDQRFCLMTAWGQNRRNEDYRSNDRFVILKRPLAKDTMNGRSWPIVFSNSGDGCQALRDVPAGFTVLSAVGALPSA